MKSLSAGANPAPPLQPLSPGANSAPAQQPVQLAPTERDRISARLRTGEAHQGGRPIARRQSLDNGSPPLHLQQQIADVEKQINAARAKDDLDGVPGALSLDLYKHLVTQHRYEKAATADLLGSQPWKRMRCAQLQSTPGGEVAAAQYGLGFAHDDSGGKAPFSKLDLAHEMNGYYQRMAPSGDTTLLCEHLYKRRYPQAKQQDQHFVNSEFMADKILKEFHARGHNHGPIKAEQVAPGIVAIGCTSNKDWQAIDILIDKFGARPSAYQVARHAAVPQGKPSPQISDPRVQNLQMIRALGSSDPQGTLSQLRQVPDILSTATLAHADADMILTLLHTLTVPHLAQRHQHNPLVAQGLQGIRHIADSMPALATDSTRFGNAHRALMEELQVVLSAVRPYAPGAFKSFASHRIRESLSQQQAAKLAPPEAFLLSSGMQALTEGIDTATMATGGRLAPLMNGSKSSQFYYEAQEYADSFDTPPDSDPHDAAFYTSLSDSFVPHSSQPEHSWALNDIIEGIGQQIEARKNKNAPLNVVIDTTIEKGGEMKALMDKFAPALADNQLRLLLCKSHQKFANLGASKVLGGSIILVGAKTPENESAQADFRRYEASQNWFGNDESQLLTHLTGAAIKSEPEMLKTAIDNANFVVKHCFNGENGHTRFAGHRPDKPFAMFDSFTHQPDERLPKLLIRGDSDETLTLNSVDMVDGNLIRARGSFGFTESNMGGIGTLPGYDGKMMRLSFGQENKPELIERFWMLSREMQLDRPPFTAQAARDLANKLVNDALTPEQQQKLLHKPLSERLRQVGKNEATPLSDSQRNTAGVSELRANAAVSHGYTLNKVASIVGYLNFLLSSRDVMTEMADSDDRQALHDLILGLTESGMPGVSRTGQEQAVMLQCQLSLEDMWNSEPEMRRFGANNLVATLEKSHLSRSVGIVDESLPNQAWQELSQAHKDRLMNAIFSRLDVNSQLEFLHSNKERVACSQFTEACAMQLAGRLRNTPPQETARHWQGTIAQAMIAHGIIEPEPEPAQGDDPSSP
ncbi:hypothetical protein [Erwinia sp. ErVv1]|uniref:hypothetical protein n=1 Tax=Erwinia sp. ErVv1 TaxID=1603299 RepID=UPI000B06F31F|nr:hypothetical protein [Erwinia sp. ErVv1]